MTRPIIINVSDAKVSNNSEDVLATYSLGSCIGVCVYDASTTIGGMLHFQLPDSTIDAQRASESPFMFADSGMQILIDKLLSMGANKKRLKVKIAGGAAMANGPSGFDIGKRNFLSIRKVLWQVGMFIDTADVGGSSPRNLYLKMSDGTVTVKCNSIEKQL
jgi:chemotaxis protein CheD